ncbi:DNA-3-methyladenine glycosylase [Cellulomonas sp. URHE0023]|uniref:DNA-3-methyladenine glycosylase family protein n=1 Tax=Cellulomonas sp. URHE0023 TaxID=1380354 RepID=UPI001E5CADE4|nr:DNA-3-methyladenine glycosylase 2 family protein [Cellulomonas sp. URHE0023]
MSHTVPVADPAEPRTPGAPGPPDDDPAAPPLTSVYRPAAPLDVRLTLRTLRRGGGDPAWSFAPDGGVWQATRTTDGPATRHLRPRADGVHVTTWGPGAERALAETPDLLGARDSGDGFDSRLHRVVHDAHRRLPGLRITRSGNVLEALVPAILEQKVVGLDAQASWRRLVRQHGSPAPGPGPSTLRVPPDAATWLAVPVWDWRRAGVDEQRAGTVQRAAAVAPRLQETVGLPTAEAYRRLLTVRGIGPWTVAEVSSRALGDADAVSVGDFHLAHLVGWALTGRRTDDAGMLELLAPWAGQRHRVIRLIELTQASSAPRFGHRAARARPMR